MRHGNRPIPCVGYNRSRHSIPTGLWHRYQLRIGFPSKVSAMGGHGSIQLYLKVIHSIIDYDAVNQNTVINPGEYQEMLDFTQGIAEKINGLPESEYKTSLTDQSQQLSTLMGAIKSDVRC